MEQPTKIMSDGFEEGDDSAYLLSLPMKQRQHVLKERFVQEVAHLVYISGGEELYE